MPSTHRLSDVKRKLRSLNCELEQRSATHWKVTRLVGGVQCVSGFATTRGARHVKDCYRTKMQRQLHFTRDEWDEA